MQRYGVLALARRGADLLIRLGLNLSVLIVVAMMALIAADVFSRSVLGVSLLIADEVSGYLLVALSFFGVAYSLRTGALLRVEFILFSLPPRLKAALGVLYDTLSLGVMLILTYYLYRVTLSSFDREMVTPTLLQTPVWIPQLAMPLGSFILVAALLLEIGLGVARALGHEPEPHGTATHGGTDTTA